MVDFSGRVIRHVLSGSSEERKTFGAVTIRFLSRTFPCSLLYLPGYIQDVHTGTQALTFFKVRGCSSALVGGGENTDTRTPGAMVGGYDKDIFSSFFPFFFFCQWPSCPPSFLPVTPGWRLAQQSVPSLLISEARLGKGWQGLTRVSKGWQGLAGVSLGLARVPGLRARENGARNMILRAQRSKGGDMRKVVSGKWYVRVPSI